MKYGRTIVNNSSFIWENGRKINLNIFKAMINIKSFDRKKYSSNGLFDTIRGLIDKWEIRGNRKMVGDLLHRSCFFERG